MDLTIHDTYDLTRRVCVKPSFLRSYSAFRLYIISRLVNVPFIKVDFPNSGFSAAIVLSHVFSSLTTREKVQVYVLGDLFTLSQMNRIDNCPFEFAAVAYIPRRQSNLSILYDGGQSYQLFDLL